MISTLPTSNIPLAPAKSGNGLIVLAVLAGIGFLAYMDYTKWHFVLNKDKKDVPKAV